MSKEVIVVSRSRDEDHYTLRGIEVENGDYKDASMFEVIFYKDSRGFTSVSPRAWYELVEDVAREEMNNKFFKEW